MARTQAKILASSWTDPDWVGLASDGKLMYWLMLSQPKLSLAGCLDVMPDRWARLAGPDWTADRVTAALHVLAVRGFVVVDEAEVVLRTFVLHDIGTGPVNSNLVKGFWSAWEGIYSPILRGVVIANCPDEVWNREGIDRPGEATRMRAYPQVKPETPPRFEPESESGPNPLLSVDCSLPTATTTTVAGSEPVAEPSDQDHRAAAVAVGKAIADRAIGLDPSKLGAYATGATRRILTGPDPADRDRITDELRSGRTGPEIADGWHRLDLGADRPTQPSGPRLDDWTGASDMAPTVDRALALGNVRALRDVIRPSEAS